MEFKYYVPIRIIFGKGSIDKVAQYTARNGSRVLLVTGRRHLKETGILDKILEAFKKTKKIEEVIHFNNVRENPTIEQVDEAKDLILKRNLNVVVAVGGGSAMDLAKAASIAAKQRRSVKELLGNPEVNVMDAYPIICSPTTSGSGSEATKYAVISDDERKIKMALSTESIYPTVSIVDPQLTYTMPQNTIANTGFDALSHAIEAFTSKSTSPVTDAYCREALKLISENLSDSYSTQNSEAMDNMSLAAMLAGLALNVGRAALPHAMEHALSAYNPNLPHGLGLAMVMTPFLKKMYKCNPIKFAEIAELLGENLNGNRDETAAEKVITAVENLKGKIGLNHRLSEFGFDKTLIHEMVEKSFWTMEHGIKNSPCEVTKEEVEKMYIEAL